MTHQVKRARRRGENAVSTNAHRVQAKTPFLKSASRAGESTIFETKNGGQATKCARGRGETRKNARCAGGSTILRSEGEAGAPKE